MQLTYDELKGLGLQLDRLDGRKKNAYGRCPSCGEDEFGISLDKYHRFGCFRKQKCGFNGNIFTLLTFFNKRIFEVVPGFEPRARLENKLMIAEEKKLDLELPDQAMPTGWKRLHYKTYLEERGFREKDYDKFEAGETKIDPRFSGYTIFAIKQFGSVKGYVARNPKSKEELERINRIRKKKGEKPELRYKNSSSDFARMLLGIEEVTAKTNAVILVEGLFDKQNTDKQLYLDDLEEVKCCCTFKCSVSDEQVFLLQERGVSKIILLYDPDVISEIKAAAWKLEDYFEVWIGFNEDGRDPGDMSQECFEKVLDNLKTPSQFDTAKLSVPELRKKWDRHIPN